MKKSKELSNLFKFLLLSSFLLVSFVLEFSYGDLFLFKIHGNWQSGDQYLAIPATYVLAEDKLFLNDLIAQNTIVLYSSSIFSLAAFFYNIFKNMFFTFFFLTFAIKAIYIFSSFFLAKLLLKNEKIAIIATFFLSFTHFMGPEEIGVSQFIAKSVVFAFVPLIFYLFFKSYRKFSIPIFIFLGILVYVHSITVVPVAILLLYSLLFIKKDPTLSITSAVIFGLFFSMYFFSVFLFKVPIDLSIYKQYASLGLLFPPHVFVGILKYFIVIVIGLLIIRKQNKEIFNWVLILFAYSSLTMFGIYSEDVILFQFFRAFKYVLYFSFLFSSVLVFNFFGKNKLLALILALIVFFPFSSIFYSNIFEGITKQPNEYLYHINDVIKIGKWVEENTSPNSTLLIPPDWASIKIWSKRSTIITLYDVGLCFYSINLSKLCRERYEDVYFVYNQSSTDEFIKVAEKYNADYIVTYETNLNLKEVFDQENFRVYEI